MNYEVGWDTYYYHRVLLYSCSTLSCYRYIIIIIFSLWSLGQSMGRITEYLLHFWKAGIGTHVQNPGAVLWGYQADETISWDCEVSLWPWRTCRRHYPSLVPEGNKPKGQVWYQISALFHSTVIEFITELLLLNLFVGNLLWKR